MIYASLYEQLKAEHLHLAALWLMHWGLVYMEIAGLHLSLQISPSQSLDAAILISKFT